MLIYMVLCLQRCSVAKHLNGFPTQGWVYSFPTQGWVYSLRRAKQEENNEKTRVRRRVVVFV